MHWTRPSKLAIVSAFGVACAGADVPGQPGADAADTGSLEVAGDLARDGAGAGDILDDAAVDAAAHAALGDILDDAAADAAADVAPGDILDDAAVDAAADAALGDILDDAAADASGEVERVSWSQFTVRQGTGPWPSGWTAVVSQPPPSMTTTTDAGPEVTMEPTQTEWERIETLLGDPAFLDYMRGGNLPCSQAMVTDLWIEHEFITGSQTLTQGATGCAIASDDNIAARVYGAVAVVGREVIDRPR